MNEMNIIGHNLLQFVIIYSDNVLLKSSITYYNNINYQPNLHSATKETAFIYAITSAGVAYAVTESCSAGNLTDCSCLAGPGTLLTTTDNSRKPRYSEVSPRSEDDGWKWGGCSDNIEFGLRYAEKFTDVAEMARQNSNESLKFDKKKELKSLVNLHNNEVGRKVCWCFDFVFIFILFYLIFNDNNTQ